MVWLSRSIYDPPPFSIPLRTIYFYWLLSLSLSLFSPFSLSLSLSLSLYYFLPSVSIFFPPSLPLCLSFAIYSLRIFSFSFFIFLWHFLSPSLSFSFFLSHSLVIFSLKFHLLSFGRWFFLDPCSLTPGTRVGAIMVASVRMVGAELLNRRLRNQITDRDTTMPMHYLWPMPRAWYTHTRARAKNAKTERGQPVDGPCSAGVRVTGRW